MTEFTELETKKEISEMSEEEARETLSEFMQEHEKNKQAYSERTDALDEKDEEIETLEERVSEFKEQKAAEAAQYVQMPESILADRFSFSELDQIIAEAEEAGVDTEYSEEEEETDEADDEPLTDFASRKQKGQKQTGGPTKANRDRAVQMLRQNDFPARD